jgi:hypothetical protein
MLKLDRGNSNWKRNKSGAHIKELFPEIQDSIIILHIHENKHQVFCV